MKKKTKKPGRPTIPAGQRRTKRLDDVRFSPDELAEIKSRAAKSGMRWSDYVRQRLAGG